MHFSACQELEILGAGRNNLKMQWNLRWERGTAVQWDWDWDWDWDWIPTGSGRWQRRWLGCQADQVDLNLALADSACRHGASPTIQQFKLPRFLDRYLLRLELISTKLSIPLSLVISEVDTEHYTLHTPGSPFHLYDIIFVSVCHHPSHCFDPSRAAS